MKVTQIFFRQHIGWHFKKHWIVQGKRTPLDTGAHKVLREKGIPIYKPEDLEEKKPFEKIDVIGYKPKPISFDNTHPDWHDKVCYTYKDSNVLLEGLNQAKVITKTVELQDGFPDKIKIETVAKEIHEKVKIIILNSHLFDAEQKKLPKIKDPERPAWNFPRIYGITHERINSLIVSKLLQLVELKSSPKIVKQRTVLNNLQFSFPFEKCGDLIQFELRGDALLLSSQPLSPITENTASDLELPDLFPLKHTITLNTDNIYKIRNIYPVHLQTQKSHPHTVFVHYDQTEVRNLFEEEVTEPQILGRSLMKTFTVAATYARQLYGEDVKELPAPVTVQCVQTDGRLFHFGILQLNTLNFEEGGIKNVWYHEPRMALFSSCCYKAGAPILEGYNTDVISYLMTFYNNV